MVLEKWSLQPELDTTRKCLDDKTFAACDSKRNDPTPTIYSSDLKTRIGQMINIQANEFQENNNSNMVDLNDPERSSQSICNTLVGQDGNFHLRRLNETSNQNSDPQLYTSKTSIDEKPKLMKRVSMKAADSLQVIDSAGYLNLIANGFDNFTHGLAIGASFMVSLKVGILTTFVIFIHEIPHEICDYAILVNSGFSRWDAVKAQSSVSLFGLIGTATSLYVKSVRALNARTAWILPFSAGGFLYIALVNLLPEILGRETEVEHSLRQIACVMLGITFMAMIAVI